MSFCVHRRAFLRSVCAGSALAGLTGVGLTGCADSPAPERYNQGDIDLLAKQRDLEIINSGQSAVGRHVYRGYRGLADLPWFELNSANELILRDDSVPSAIDTHCHLGMSVLFEPDLDLQANAPRTKHLLDCDEFNPGCTLDLDRYVNGNFTEESLKRLKSTVRSQGLWGNSIMRTQTIANLVAEMDAMRVSSAIVLPIKLGFWFGDNLTEDWRRAVSASAGKQRLKVGFSVHPRQTSKIEELRRYAAQSDTQSNIKVMKLHPTVQRFYPDDPSMMELYAEAERLGVTVFFHGGRAGIEPEASHRYAMPRHYEAVFANFPKLNIIVGHAGARDNHAMLKLALRYDNVWLDIHGQSLTRLGEMIRATGGERLLFGSDWPFYHLGVSLAKVLIATESESRQTRARILRGNAGFLLER